MTKVLPEIPRQRPAAASRKVREPARGRLLIVNQRGFRRADALYRELGALGWNTTVLDVEEPALLRGYAMARSFHPSLSRWRTRLDRTANRLARTAFAFTYKSRWYGRMIARSGVKPDVILQCGGMFAPGWPCPATPYAVTCDCTVKLGEGERWSGVDFASRATAARWYALEGMLFRNARCVFSASRYAARSVIEDYGVDPGRVVTIGEGCNLEAPDIPDRYYDGKTILYVGYEFERKGGEVLLAAFERVAAEIRDAELLIAGPRRIPSPLPRGVTFLGPTSPERLLELYARASIFVMPSLFEPFGLVFLEAMAHKLPCIGSDRCAIPEIILDGETGVIAPAGDAHALARLMMQLLRDPETMRRMGERGRQRVAELFTWSRVARQVDERLLELL